MLNDIRNLLQREREGGGWAFMISVVWNLNL